MKTILSRMKTLVADNNGSSGTLSYVRESEVVHPEIALTTITVATLPKILFVPVSTVEAWAASGRKEAVNIVEAFLILMYHQRESNIIGDSSRPGGQGKGITDFVADFISVFRGHRLAVSGTNYLSKPLDILEVAYFREDWSESAHLIVAMVRMECVRLFDQITLPGNV